LESDADEPESGRRFLAGKIVQENSGVWCRAAAAWHDWQGAKFARFATTCAKWL